MLSGAVAASFAVTPLFALRFVSRFSPQITSPSPDSEFTARWGALFSDLNAANKPAVLSFWPIFIVRRTVLAVTLILTPDDIKLFGVLNSLVSVAVLSFMTVFRPYKSKLMLVETVVTELSTTLVYVSAASFSFDFSSDVRTVMGAVGVWTVRFALGFSITTAMAHSVASIVVLFRERARLGRIESKLKFTWSKTTTEKRISNVTKHTAAG